MEYLMKFLPFILGIAGFSGVGAILNWVLKKYVTQKKFEVWGDKFEKFMFNLFYRIFKIVTLGLSAWKWTSKIWNPIIEPYVILLFKFVFKRGVNGSVNGTVAGLESDNPSLADD